MNFLFLYTELADYTLACLHALKEKHPKATINVVHYPVNPEAPFMFDFNEVGNFADVKHFSKYDELKRFVEQGTPDKIICSGWVNKWYLRICWEFRNKATCVLTMDNHWFASPRQYFMRVVGKLLLTHIFRKAWVPGNPQLEYAKKLGFREKDIARGFYACDTSRFLQLGTKWLPEKEREFPQRILCVARYIPAKGYAELWKAFIEWQDEEPNDWELWCVGTGEGYDARVEHPKIHHFGFLQKHEWDKVIRNTGIFILPSHFEPWGVVVHEFAAAGYPLVLSDKVGAGELFLTEENGWQIQSGDIHSLKSVFRKISNTSADLLVQKASVSRDLAAKHSLERWAETLYLL